MKYLLTIFLLAQAALYAQKSFAQVTNWESSPYNYNNSPYNYNNSPSNYNNSPSNYSNNQSNYNATNGVFDNSGNRIGYTPAKQ